MRHLLRTYVLALAALGTSACPGPEAEPFIGELEQDVQMELVYRTVEGTVAACTPDGEVPIVRPPQGGQVILVAPRARNLNPLGVQLSVHLTDECTGRIVALEQRPVNLVDTGDGWGVPERPATLSNFSNLAVCPSASRTRDLDGNYYQLTIELTDRDGRKSSGSMRIMPVCGEPGLAEDCACECDADYVLGEGCLADPVPNPVACGE
jgi:hypothetical protein